MPEFDLATLDVYDPDQYVERVPHEKFAFLRAHDPVFWQRLPDGGGCWILTKHRDVIAASADPATFSAELGGVVIEELAPERIAQMRGQLLAMDPPRHREVRRKVLVGFTPGLVGRMEPFLRERARAVMAAAAERRSVNFVYDLAAALPLQVICEIFGIPEVDRAWVVEAGDRVIGRDDPELGASEDSGESSVKIGSYGFQLATERTGKGGDDLISLLVNAPGGNAVSAVEFANLFIQLIVAGNETTRTLLTGTLLELLENPDAYRALEAGPSLLPVAVEEMLRWTTPVHYFRRTATRDAELGGKKIREGDRVVLHYTSADFDETVFAEPMRFDIRRDPNPHLAFGWGEHFCLGAKLARMEARIFWEEFFASFARVELTGPVRRMRSNLNNSHKEIPVRLTPR
ncbi:MAG: cytochrome P450 [Myxococcota bacterium]